MNAFYSDDDLQGAVYRLQQAIITWSQKQNLWYDCGFTSYAEHIDAEPKGTPVVTIMWFDGDLGRMLDGDFDGMECEFSDLLDAHGFWYERNDGTSIHIYPNDDNPMMRAFADYIRWQWICGLLQPDFADVHEEIYEHFVTRPEDLHRLGWREFEILLYRVFQNQGFQAELGPGSGDGGVDIRLLQRDPLGDMMTLVQAKKYAPKRKIGLEAVAALHGVAAVETAPRSLFVTTSSYQPAAKTFAARTSGAMTLATSDDVARWCRDAVTGIVQDKSTLVSSSHVEHILRNLQTNDPRIVHADAGVTMQMNSFALILKETKHAALMMTLPRQKVSGDSYGQIGTEAPRLGEEALQNLNADGVFRVKRSVRSGRASYWNGSNLFFAWDGQPTHFNYMD